MARRNNRNNNRGGSNRIQNVRLVDKDEGGDDVKVSSILSQMSLSESQVRIVCGYQANLSPAAQAGGIVAFDELQSTDDWVTFSAQFKEFRVRAIQFRIFDTQPNSAAVVNYWATFHTLGGSVGNEPNNIVDRPDARVISPGTGWTELAWVAHGQPEMEFQSVGTAITFGGMVYNVSPAAAITGVKYQITAKFIVDFRARI